MRTVWSLPSTCLMCCIRAAKARASASCVAAPRRAEDFDWVAVLDDAGKALRILLDPDGRVAGHAVFPGGEPEEDDALVVRRGLVEKAVDKREVEVAFLGLDRAPN